MQLNLSNTYCWLILDFLTAFYIVTHRHMDWSSLHSSDKVGKTFEEANVAAILVSYLFICADAGKNVR